MTEDQKPFIHQDGTSTPPGPTRVTELLHTSNLAKLVRLLADDEEIIQSLDNVALADELLWRRRAIDVVQLLQEPRVNTTVTALKALDPSMQALVSDVAIALVVASPGSRQTLANALRKLIEGRS